MLRVFVCAVFSAAMSAFANPSIDALWEYGDPAASEARFRARLEQANGDERLELLTQVARTYGLRRRFDEAHRLLDEIEPQLASAGAAPRVRHLLERGRTFNSAGRKDEARGLFEEAWRRGREAKLEGLAVDAAHMVAITHAGTPSAIQWNQAGLSMARQSSDPKARALVPAMLNNMAWDLHAMGRFEEALPVFRDAEAAWTERGGPRQVQVAKWSVAQCLRSLGRVDEAAAIERALDAEGFKS